MRSLSIRLKGVLSENKEPAFSIEHDCRLFNEEKRPSYINYEETQKNFFLYTRDDIPRSYKDIKNFLAKVEEENRLIFLKLKEKNMIKRNQGYKIKSPTLHGILTLSKEAQQSITNPNMREVFFSKAKEYLLKLANQLGTDLLYAVVHLDETAPHIHFCMRNIRYKISTSDKCFEFSTDEKAIGKSLTNSFCVKDKWQQREHMIELTKIQDSLNFFSDIGFSRGIPKKEKLQQGATKYETVHMTVKELHENLPKQLAERKSKMLAELREYERQLKIEKERKKKEYDEEIRKLSEEYLKKVEEVKKMYESQLNAMKKEYQENIKKITEEHQREIKEMEDKHKEYIKKMAEEHQREIKEIENIHQENIKKMTEGHQREIKEMEDKHKEYIKKMAEEHQREIEKLREKYEKEIQKIKEQYAQDKETYMQLEKSLIEKHNKLLNQIENAQAQIKNLQKEIDKLDITKINAEKECAEKEEKVKQLSQEIKILAITKNMLEDLIEIREQAEKQVKSQIKSQNQGFRLDM